MANKTKASKAVMEVLKTSLEPLSAKNILNELHKQNINACLSTVYRILLKFEKEEIVVKSYLNDSNNKFFELNNNEHKHYAICLLCDKMTGIKICPVYSIHENIEENFNFEVTNHKLEIYGYCKDCKIYQ